MLSHAAAELLQASAAVAAVTRLLYLNLAKQFPALTAFLAFLAVFDIGLGLQDQRSVSYFWSYIALEPVFCILGILAVRELLALTFREYPGIRTAGRWAMYACTTLSLGISLSVTGLLWGGGAMARANSHYVYYVEIAKRSVVFSLAAVLITLLVFLSRYPLDTGVNTMVCSLAFSALFLSEAARLLLDSTMEHLSNQAIDRIQEGFIFICLFGWTLFLQRESSAKPPPIRIPSEREEYLLHQLDSLNEVLARAVRR